MTHTLCDNYSKEGTKNQENSEEVLKVDLVDVTAAALEGSRIEVEGGSAPAATCRPSYSCTAGMVVSINNDSSNFDIIHDVASTSDNCSSWRPLNKKEEKQEMIFMYVNG